MASGVPFSRIASTSCFESRWGSWHRSPRPLTVGAYLSRSRSTTWAGGGGRRADAAEPEPRCVPSAEARSDHRSVAEHVLHPNGRRPLTHSDALQHRERGRDVVTAEPRAGARLTQPWRHRWTPRRVVRLLADPRGVRRARLRRACAHRAIRGSARRVQLRARRTGALTRRARRQRRAVRCQALPGGCRAATIKRQTAPGPRIVVVLATHGRIARVARGGRQRRTDSTFRWRRRVVVESTKRTRHANGIRRGARKSRFDNPALAVISNRRASGRHIRAQYVRGHRSRPVEATSFGARTAV